MPKINVLDKHVAELIAAGEVVERPASVIKELVENSIDAGASAITVEICRGGITFMRVTDNGCGIDRDDVEVAFLRHATSKVLVQTDLDSIGTLGFRGEALASISAVSHVELITKPREAECGTRAVCDAGEITEINDAGCPDGTTIIVRDLFFNVPARMKFLKKDVAEGNSVARIIDKVALSHPEISFRFIRDGKETLHTPGDNKLKSSIYAVFGKEFTGGLIPVNYELGGIRVYGFISSPHSARPNRNMQNFFINGRCVRSKTAMAALDEAYKNTILVGKFPACVLHLQMDFSQVDVNVHPTKLEVRFTNERPVFDAVYHAAKSALTKGDTPKVMEIKPNSFAPYAPTQKAEQAYFPESSYTKKQNPPSLPFGGMEDKFKSDARPAPKPAAKSGFTGSSLIDKIKAESFSSMNADELSEADEITAEDIRETDERIESLVREAHTSHAPKSEGDDKTEKAEIKSEIKSEIREEIYKEERPREQIKIEVTLPTVEETKSEHEVGIGEIKGIENKPAEAPKAEDELPTAVPGSRAISSRFVGEVFSTYIILQLDEERMMFIDKHAAHERILYEKLKKTDDGKNAQVLLSPVPLVLEKDDYNAVLENLDKFSEVGFEIDDFGDGTVLIRTAPMLLDGHDAADAVTEIAAYLTSNKNTMSTEYMDWLYHNIACRAAVKAGNKNSDAELIEIAKLLEENPEIRYCPHGRPVYLVIRKRDLEREFGRIQ